MALFWFLLALVLLVAALVILRLDARQRGGGVRGQGPEVGDTSVLGSGEEPGSDADAHAHADGAGVVDDDDEGMLSAPPAGADRTSDEPADESGESKLAPFQRTDTRTASGADIAPGRGTAAASTSTSAKDAGAGTDAADAAVADETMNKANAVSSSVADPGTDAAEAAESEAHPGANAEADADAQALAAATAANAHPAQPAGAASEPTPLDPSEPTVESSPRLLDRVRALLPARRTNGRAIEPVETEPMDPLAGSPVVRWLEDREFAPTPTPAPEFRHGDFAGGLSALGTVSHGVFRGRRAIMGVTGGRTVLALRRDTSSDVVLDLSRPDVDAEPGFHDAGEVGVLEARTSDYGRLDLIDRDRLTESVKDVPASVRRIWAEGEWVAATIDSVDDPIGWDDVVMALHGAADVLAPFPPIGGRARALPAEMDPGSPAAAQGPEADPTMGMDGEVGTGTQGIAPLPDPEDHVVADPPTAPDTGGQGDETTAVTAPTSASPAPGQASTGAASTGAASTGAASTGAAETAGPTPKRAGHLRLVPDRSGARDLSNVPVKADRGDSVDALNAAGEAEGAGTEVVDPRKNVAVTKAAAALDGEPAADTTAGDPVSTEAAEDAPADTGADVAAKEPSVEEADPFAEIMEPSGPVEARGDVAADHLEPRPPLSRPTRGAGQAYPEDATVPPLAAGVATGGAGIKPLGSEDDEDEIRDEVERFDAARIDGGSDFDEPNSGRHGAPNQGSGGRHGADDVDPSEVTQTLSVAELAERLGVDPAEMRSAGRRRRRAKSDDANDGDAADSEADPAADAKADSETDAKTDTGSQGSASGRRRAQGRERPGVEPDVERTARIQLPPDIKD